MGIRETPGPHTALVPTRNTRGEGGGRGEGEGILKKTTHPRVFQPRVDQAVFISTLIVAAFLPPLLVLTASLAALLRLLWECGGRRLEAYSPTRSDTKGGRVFGESSSPPLRLLSYSLLHCPTSTDPATIDAAPGRRLVALILGVRLGRTHRVLVILHRCPAAALLSLGGLAAAARLA